jgi:hypothetical protein
MAKILGGHMKLAIYLNWHFWKKNTFFLKLKGKQLVNVLLLQL